MKPFEIQFDENQKVKVIAKGGLSYHPVLWKVKLSSEAKKFFFQLCELLDDETGMLVQRFSDKKKQPLSKNQLAVYFNDKRILRAIDELVAHGILAEFTVMRTNFYVVNPYIVTYGFRCNSYLANIFNKITLNRVDMFSEFFNQENSAEICKLWGVLNVK